MTSGASTMKWIGLWLLQIPVYLVTSYLIRTLMTVAYLLLLKIGVDMPPNLLLEHFLWVSLVGGFIAGLVGVALVRTLLLLCVHTEHDAKSAWNKPQAWTWVLPSCWLLFGIIAWFGSRGHGSVLETSQGPNLLHTFFGSGCSLGRGDFHDMALGSCMKQATFTHPWLGTVGYSAAAFFPLGRWMRGVAAEDAKDQNSEVQAAL